MEAFPSAIAKFALYTPFPYILAFPANILSGNELEMSVTRGKWFDIKIREKKINYNAISMFHPRDLLLKPENKKETWEDLKDIKKKFSE